MKPNRSTLEALSVETTDEQDWELEAGDPDDEIDIYEIDIYKIDIYKDLTVFDASSRSYYAPHI